MRTVIAAFAVALGLLALPAGASAAIPSVLGSATCTTADDDTRECSGRVDTFDSVPIDVNVAFPPEPSAGPDGSYPLIMVFHGWGGRKAGFDDLRRWTSRGYAAFSMTVRGFNESCGKSQPAPDPDCLNGYIRLMDTRYEVRDAQEFAGRLADQGVIDPQRIGATGGSYGGGLSMALAALRTRKMLPDGSLVPWTSPTGTPMRIAAAAPEIPWTDLAYSLAPNGGTLDYVTDNPYAGNIGVLKQSFVAGLFALGQVTGNYAPPGLNPDADLNNWYARVNAGEPYDGDPVVADMIDELTTHHSSYYINDSIAPAPLLISNGWTDDLFPADEAIRFYNRTRARHPASPISLFFLDYGHQRGQSKSADVAALRARQEAWFAHYVKGDGPEPAANVTAITQTCPEAAPSGGPFTAPSWGEIAPGEVRLSSQGARTIAPAGGNPETNQAFDPIAGPGACATTPAEDAPGTATYRLDPAPASGYTLLGSPTITAAISSPSPNSHIAARLLDVAPDGTQTLVARGLYRPGLNVLGAREVFQLHPNGWRFEPGHIAKLELLPNDAPYGRASNGQGPVTVTDLQLRLPVLERPGTGGGVVEVPAPKPLPPDDTLAPDFRRSRIGLARGRVRVRGRRLLVPIRCRGNNGACTVSIGVRGLFRKDARRRSARIAQRPVVVVSQNRRRTLALRLTKAGRALFSSRRRLRVRILLRSEAGSKVAFRIATRSRS